MRFLAGSLPREKKGPESIPKFCSKMRILFSVMVCFGPRNQSMTKYFILKVSTIRRMSETPTTTASPKSIGTIAVCLQFVSQCSWCPYGLRNGKYCQLSSHLYCSTPPSCIAIRLPFVSQCFWEKPWWLWSPLKTVTSLN